MPTERTHPVRPRGLMALASILVLITSPAAPADDGGMAGARIYKTQCASCHGASGEGTKDEYPHPLAGDRSVSQLSRLIARTMPSDDPGTCTGDDADRVSRYIYDTFYSRTARERNRPARIELARLTVRQYRNAVADLLGSFRDRARWDDRRGLQAEYYKSKRMGRKEDRVIERVDPEVRFDFKKASPDPEKVPDPKEFAIRWQGAVLAPETGDYEFVVRTENSARLWVNDLKRPLIDASVKSGNDTEYRGTIRLLGGRPYPIKLDYSKAKQGVEDSKEDKAKAEVALGSVALEWKVPGRAPEMIPARALSPTRFPELFIPATPFPPDDRSIGYERGNSISKAWDQATTDSAIEVAGYVAGHLKELSGVADDAPDRRKKLEEFGLRLVERAFRRPLTGEQKAFYVERQFKEAKDPETAIKRVVLLTLKSPRFLYQGAAGKVDDYEVASRLSFGLWDSLPDNTLLEAAAKGQLSRREQVAQQAWVMLDDLRARSKLRGFLMNWLRVDQAPEIAKDQKLYPGFDAALLSDLRVSLELFLDDVAWGDSPDFRRLLLSDELFLNGRLAKYYGADLPADAPFRKVKLESKERAGVLSHPYLLSTFAYTSTSSPIHRGVFIARSVLGRSLRPPPEAVAPLAPDLHAGLSTRERVALQTSPSQCMTCHGMINPLGFGLERFDAVGRLRAAEKGKPVDATGSYDPPVGEPAPYSGARELSALLAGSEETHAAFVEQLFHDLVKQPIRAYGPGQRASLRSSFAAHDYNIRRLMVDIMAESALAGRGNP